MNQKQRAIQKLARKLNKIIDVLGTIVTPIIIMYSIVSILIIFRTVFAYIMYGEFNLDLYENSFIGLERCSPDWGGRACRPPLNDFTQFIEWNALTRTIMIVSIMWWIVIFIKSFVEIKISKLM